MTIIFYHLPFVLAAAVLSLRLKRSDRDGVVSSLVLYALGLLGQLSSGLFQLSGGSPATMIPELSVLVLGVAGIRLAGLILFRVLLPEIRLTAPRILEDLAVFGGYVVWSMIRLSHLGLDLGSIVTTSAVITGIIAFSMQDTLGNILGGMTLQLETSIHLGDWIKVDDVVGRVVNVRWRSTVIETRNWETVVVPNSVLMRTRFTILGRRAGEPLQWRRWVWFHVDITVAPTQVIQTVENTLKRATIPNVAADPAASCVLMDINGGSGHYAVRYWLTDLAVDDLTDSAVRSHVVIAFHRADINFAFQQQTVHLVPAGEKHELGARPGIERARQLVHTAELFEKLDDTERDKLAAHLEYTPFLAGETITRQGDVAHWLYLIGRGELDVVLDAGGHKRVIGTIRSGERGDFFGEMGMLTGEPRTANVVARTDVECYRLDKESFEQILRERPSIAEEVSAVMARRRADLAAVHEALDQEARDRLLDASRYELLNRIRRFFGLETADLV
jgi:small-conductance mechanosensitive channel/CRP-like cAMP-binding protein